MTNKQFLIKQIVNMSDAEFMEVVSLKYKHIDCGIIECAGMSCEECITGWLNAEHKEPIKLSDAEKVILENIDKDYKWIVRGKDGTLTLYSEKPTKEDTCWEGYDVCDFWAYDHLFQFIKWEDTEPYNIEELLKGK